MCSMSAFEGLTRPHVSIKIPAELFEPAALETFSGTLSPVALVRGAQRYSFNEPLTYMLTLTHTGEAFVVAGTLHASVTTPCARCLDDARYECSASFTEYVFVSEEAAQSKDLEDDEFFVLPANHELDIIEMISSALVLELPNLIVCSDDCKGLCSVCGCNLNKETCSCAEKRAATNAEQHPFAQLRSLLDE